MKILIILTFIYLSLFSEEDYDKPEMSSEEFLFNEIQVNKIVPNYTQRALEVRVNKEIENIQAQHKVNILIEESVQFENYNTDTLIPNEDKIVLVIASWSTMKLAKKFNRPFYQAENGFFRSYIVYKTKKEARLDLKKYKGSYIKIL